jgi:hypothetical protein
MTLHRLAALLAFNIALSACSGGGSAGNPTTSSAQGAPASGTLTISLSNNAGTASRLRKPAYISPSTTQATLFIDSSTSGFRTPCTATGPSPTCAINWTSTSGTHTFSVEIDDGITVLAEGSESVNLLPGTNTVPEINLNGLPAVVALVSEALCTTPTTQCTGGTTSGATSYIQGSFQIEDADGNVISTPGLLLQGGVCLSGGGILFVDIFQGQQTFVGAPCSSNSPTVMTFELECLSIVTDSSGVLAGFAPSTGTVTLSADWAGTAPLAPLSISQLNAVSVAYPSGLTMVGWPTYTCASGAIAAAGSSNGTINVQSHKT